jgi:hypothetical protein
MLQLPPTLRTPRIDEVPNYSGVLDKFSEIKNSNIEEGYIFHENLTSEYPFKFFAEINIDNSKLWTIFVDLLLDMPNDLSCIYNLLDNDPKHSVYRAKDEILECLENYKTELVQDCRLEFGLISNTEIALEEVFISSVKYLKYWGINDNSFRQKMHKHGLVEISKIKFIDEFPYVIEPLTLFNSNVKDSNIVIEEIDNFFK